jgi:hypothetical protein
LYCFVADERWMADRARQYGQAGPDLLCAQAPALRCRSGGFRRNVSWTFTDSKHWSGRQDSTFSFKILKKSESVSAKFTSYLHQYQHENVLEMVAAQPN